MYSGALSPAGPPDLFMIAAHGRASMGEVAIAIGGSTCSSTAWPSASRAVFIPFTISERHTYLRACLANGATLSGNFDIGVYSMAGTRLFSTGTTAQAGSASLMRVVTINWTLDPGNYYLALVVDNTTATVIATPPSASNLRSNGCKQMAAAFVLPSTATFAAYASGFLPVFGICEKTWL